MAVWATGVWAAGAWADNVWLGLTADARMRVAWAALEAPDRSGIAANRAETVRVFDTVTAQAAVAAIRGETVEVVDVPDAPATTYVRVAWAAIFVAEGAASPVPTTARVFDTPTARLGLAAARAETAQVLDAPTTQQALATARAETVRVFDTPDAQAAGAGSYSGTVAETVRVFDTPTARQAIAAARAETARVFDTPTGSAAGANAYSDAVATTARVFDTPTARQAIAAARAESVRVFTTATGSAPAHVLASVAESITVRSAQSWPVGPNDYPILPQWAGTVLRPRTGVIERLARNGSFRAHAIATVVRNDPVVVHEMLSDAERASLVAFHAAHRESSFFFNAAEDGSSRRCLFAADPQFERVAGAPGFHRATVYLRAL